MSENEKTDFWQRFVTLTYKKKKSISEVRNELGVSPGTLTNWKNGALPRGEMLVRIAVYFHCSIDFLCGYSVLDKSIQHCVDNIINHISKLPYSEQCRAIADIIELLESKYPIELCRKQD